jgi:hypothetical protein
MAIFATGIAVFAWGIYLETRNPRTNAEDDFAWQVLGAGTFLIGIGATLRFLPLRLVARLPIAIVIGIMSPFFAFALAVFVIWSVVILFY